MGVASTCQSSLAWSSSQFRVTLPGHVRLESNLLWWKDKETLIEILPPGHFVFSFHMGLTSYFPAAQRCTLCLTPRSQQRSPVLDSMWQTVKYKQNIRIVTCKLLFWPQLWQKLFSFPLDPKESFSSCSSSAGSTQALLCHPIDPPLYCNGWMYWKYFLSFVPTRLSFPPLLARTRVSERFISVCAGESVSFLVCSKETSFPLFP